jgi:aminoglycoside phosphotransferase (APT) family kinase protein
VRSLAEDQLQAIVARTGEKPAISGMAGATSSDLYLLAYPDHREVLRIFRAERWKVPAASLSQQEVQILQALIGTSIPTPAPIATFMNNGVLMSWLRGVVRLPWQPGRTWLARLAATLAEIHTSAVTVPYLYESWNDTRTGQPPTWWRDAGLWAEAQARSAARPAFEPTFIHRDYHPVNVLWDDGQISGVVDWINACMGPAGVDVAHCRGNLAVMYGLETADAFLAAYQEASPGYRHHPYWDLDDALSAMPNVDVYPPWREFGLSGLTADLVRQRLIAFVEAALR